MPLTYHLSVKEAWMYVHGYTDDGDDNNVTLISRLDMSNPLHLHLNDSTAVIVVSVKLKRTEKYQVWSCVMLLTLEGKNKFGFIDGSYRRSNTGEVIRIQYDIVNVVSAYDIISKEESHRVASISISETSQRSQTSAFTTNMPNRGNYQRS
ncbi:ribonuclease H-like domain-containing protein [Tanacetum coccineum]